MRPILPCLDDLVRLLELRHAPLLHADLHDPAMPVLRLDRRRTLGEVVRQRLLDVDVLARGARVDEDRHVPVVRSPDHDGVDIAPLEHIAIVDGDEGLRVRQFLPLLAAVFPHVADGAQADPRHACKHLHEHPAAPAGSDAADVQSVVRRVVGSGKAVSGQGEGRRRHTELLQDLSSMALCLHLACSGNQGEPITAGAASSPAILRRRARDPSARRCPPASGGPRREPRQ